jgi:hypothetical protein
MTVMIEAELGAYTMAIGGMIMVAFLVFAVVAESGTLEALAGFAEAGGELTLMVAGIIGLLVGGGLAIGGMRLIYSFELRGVAGTLERSLQSGQPSLASKLILVMLALAYAVLVWVYLLGG